MANVVLWKKVKVAMQSAIGTAIAITAISKASPAVANATGIASISDGDYVLLKVQGMTELNNKVVRVANKNTSDFELEGVDSTLYNDFVSGTLELLTMGTTFDSFLDVNASGGEAPDIDTTTIHDDQASAIPGLPAASVFSFNSLWDSSNTALLAAKAASDAQAQRAFLFTFANGQKFLINGYVSCPLNPAGTAQEKVTSPVKITSNGLATTYAT